MTIAKRESPFDRWVEVASVVLISLATVLTAWCGYESARWTSLQTRSYNEASSQRLQASVQSARSNTLETVDVATFLQFVRAVATHTTEEQDFIYKRFRPEMKVAVDAWIATKPRTNPAAPPSPFAMPEYRLATSREAERLNASASESFLKATAANENGDQYVRLTVIFAAVSFLAGISTRFFYPNHLIVVVLGFGALAFGLIRMFELPIR
ncbi:MAG TPA: hypothetical protein VK760_05350 [Candidatus Acidoferrales bacterium]|jgi:hypothetical protein|nr:hypothetical protein [Candidatus Acidoferrales bacterium]